MKKFLKKFLIVMVALFSLSFVSCDKQVEATNDSVVDTLVVDTTVADSVVVDTIAIDTIK